MQISTLAVHFIPFQNVSANVSMVKAKRKRAVEAKKAAAVVSRMTLGHASSSE